MTPGFNFSKLQRYPVQKRDLLQAWDAADELLVQHLRTLGLRRERLILLNDSFGALSSALSDLPEFSDLELTAYTDSYISSRSTLLNTSEKVRPLHRLEDISGEYDIVVIRIPKNMSFFEDQLAHLSQHLKPGGKLIAGYMVKHQANASFTLLERHIGETTTSLAQKKARLIFCSFTREATKSPYPKEILLEGFKTPFTHHSNLFSREKLDIGTRFFLQYIPAGEFTNIVDLGCANGIIGIAAKKKNSAARIIFSDESSMAVESARLNYTRNFPDATEDSAHYLWTHCYEGQPAASVDLVLCNPPFHQGTTVGDFIATQMFRDAHHALAPGGLLRVIGNTHLRYPQLLNKLFGNSRIVATNSKFTITDAVKR